MYNKFKSLPSFINYNVPNIHYLNSRMAYDEYKKRKLKAFLWFFIVL